MKNIEIEIRYEVRDKKELLNWLDENAEQLYTTQQIDEYFVPAHRNFLSVTPIKEWLRIRKTANKSKVTYKNWEYDEKGDTTHKAYELETEIKDSETFREIFKALDMQSAVTVEKNRIAYRYKGFEIVVDEVAGLGVFCEIEADDVEGSLVEIRKKIENLFQEIGCLKEADEILEKGYPYALLKKEGKFESLSESFKTDKVKELEGEIRNLSETISKIQDEKNLAVSQLKKALADYSNLEKNLDKRLDLAMTRSSGKLAQGVISVLDDMKMAVEALESVNMDKHSQAWADGVLSTMDKLKTILEDMGVEKIEVKEGDKFDSEIHEALSVEHNLDYRNNEILKVIQDGYVLGDTVVRAARVIVNKVKK